MPTNHSRNLEGEKGAWLYFQGPYLKNDLELGATIWYAFITPIEVC